MERVLERLVERIKETVRQTSNKEEGRDERKAEVDLALAEVVGGDRTLSGGTLRLAKATHVGSRRDTGCET